MPELTKKSEIPPTRRHDWATWADGQWRTFYQDTDFPDRTPIQLAYSARAYAKRHGLHIATSVKADRVLIQMWPREDTTSDRGDTPPEPATE